MDRKRQILNAIVAVSLFITIVSAILAYILAQTVLSGAPVAPLKRFIREFIKENSPCLSSIQYRMYVHTCQL